MNAEDFVSYEQAVKLKECGFGEPCITYLNPKYGKRVAIAGKEITMNECVFPEVLCPSLSQAAKWLREVKGVIVVCTPEIDMYDYNDSIREYLTGEWNCTLWRGREEHWNPTGKTYTTYESALSAGIDAALELIREKA